MSKKSANPSDIENPTVLAFERKLDPSDALFYAGCWNDRDNASNWAPIKIRTKSVRGTISHYIEDNDTGLKELNADIKNPNPQTVDVAMLPTDADTLKVQFTLRVLRDVGIPSACNEPEYKKELEKAVNGYAAKEKFTELANRYAANLANGRFLWRNRLGAENVQVKVALLKDGKEVKEESWSFDSLGFDLRKLDDIKDEKVRNHGLQKLSTAIADGLAGTRHVLLQVTAFTRQGIGQEVFPSQEMILGKNPSDKKKTLYDVNGVAAFHSQKIGNALRTIDTWHKSARDLGPIAVEPYGSVTTQGEAYRKRTDEQDFYTLLDNWLLDGKELSMEEQHFVMAVLIRGGVFSREKKSNKKKVKGAAEAERDSDDES